MGLGREQAEDRKQPLLRALLFNMHWQITQIPVRPAGCSPHRRLRPPLCFFIYFKPQQFFLVPTGSVLGLEVLQAQFSSTPCATTKQHLTLQPCLSYMHQFQNLNSPSQDYQFYHLSAIFLTGRFPIIKTEMELAEIFSPKAPQHAILTYRHLYLAYLCL